MERSAVPPGCHFHISLSCLVSRVISENRDEGVERAILLRDGLKTALSNP
jgi:hypothetical protein